MGDLQVRGLSKRLGDHLAVDDVSFQVDEGEFFVLLGSSGSGKTTTLRMVCGLENPDSGQILLAGKDVTKLPPRDRNLGMVFQEYGLYPAMDVRGNIAYGLQARGKLDKAEIDRRVVDAADKLGLSEMLDQSTQLMSGGEQQRVALARAMVKDADAYLFDEPLSNLDPKLRYRARRDIKAVHQAKRQPSVYVTHDQSEAFALADRIGVMAGGRLQQVGTPDELLESPANVFVARFVGSPGMNVLSFATSEIPSILTYKSGQPYEYKKDRVLVGFRPEAMSLATGDGMFGGRVLDVEEGLTELVIRFETDGGDTVIAALEEDVELSPGDKVSFDVAPEKLHLFDIDTEQALSRDA